MLPVLTPVAPDRRSPGTLSDSHHGSYAQQGVSAQPASSAPHTAEGAARIAVRGPGNLRVQRAWGSSRSTSAYCAHGRVESRQTARWGSLHGIAAAQKEWQGLQERTGSLALLPCRTCCRSAARGSTWQLCRPEGCCAGCRSASERFSRTTAVHVRRRLVEGGWRCWADEMVPGGGD